MKQDLPKSILHIEVDEGKQYEVSYYLLKKALPGLNKLVTTEAWGFVTESVIARTFTDAKNTVKARLESEGRTARNFIVREVNSDVTEGTV